MGPEEDALIEAACLEVLEIPFMFVFVMKDGFPVEVKVVAGK